MRFFQNANYPFLQWRKRAYVVTAALLGVGIGSMIYHAARGEGWLNYGVDFTGGTVVQVAFTHPVTAEQVRAATSAAGHADWEITKFGSGNDYVVRTPKFGQEAGADAQSRVRQALSTRFREAVTGRTGGDFKIVRTEAVGPKAGSELEQRALIAILLSFVAILGYLALRFEWRFATAAVIATMHDVLVTLGFLAVTRTEISLGTVAAVLTVLGYSMHDTIIVFDRVREDLAKPRHGRTFVDILNKAINETLPRTTLTVATVMATLLALLAFGGPVIFGFTLVLVLGIAIGTFSSIFVASPVLYEIERHFPRQEKREQAVRSQSGRRPTQARPAAEARTR
ncbi:MAG TPA: protein translocase subunit SecF [Longimicrobium sp.]|jgi:preprotein translocase subunit SecF|nr:protein translocase subunit SecF [Longimicrobium sp.]